MGLEMLLLRKDLLNLSLEYTVRAKGESSGNGMGPTVREGFSLSSKLTFLKQG